MYRQHGSPPWLVWDSIIRHSHYDFDVDSFVLRPAEEPVLIVPQSGPRGGMDVAGLGAFACGVCTTGAGLAAGL